MDKSWLHVCTFLDMFYITILRPLVFECIPSILKWIWFGIILLVILSIRFLVLDTVGHLDTSHSTECFLTNKYSIFPTNDSSEPLDVKLCFSLSLVSFIPVVS